ncbi:2-succinyl-6-hydroxy-2,4-cyclohexadiene-1-carboxylate synthase MenH [Cupriavidus necator]|uniref:Alpha/beta hydrolase n=1 Tax=Cupriavidus necator (strain ATCC 17699 / DSM 428 / KCTC 22496 / NCIMB 10442 / H16 / Stanier 337) TaxID=381666 RepID=Q0K221_CUPNH|nr:MULTISPECIES: alpha/beta hydrolase [Cupriavidus]EON16657.1 alpha/beta fold family hydrolase [Cupriavidus sp. GA3-3]KUE89202.1 hydrolase [Cupriavidus necator]QCC03827.1 alpha/beta hydrolase [Cupriavidus necator H16]QQB80886.1 alpha/beta hydrolase [Cupriavidus necator]WKA45187.1 alpha/beta hydrolase [Cupriavidus necator]
MSRWVFLRGLTRESRHWGSLPARWEAAGLGRPLLPDLPGNGALSAQPAPWSVPEMVTAVRRQLSATGAHGPYRVLAMSLGAMAATEWASAYPEEVGGLVLVNTSMRPFCTPAQRLRPRNWGKLLRVAQRWQDRAYCERTIHAITCARTDTLARDLETWQAIAADAPVSRQAALAQLLAAARYRAPASAPRCPALLLASAADRLVNPVCSARIAQAWDAQLLTHHWAGHDLPHDDPQWLCNAVAGSVILTLSGG